MSRLLTALILCLLLFSTVIPQQPQPSPPPIPQIKNENQKVQDSDVVKITTNLVQVDAVITDAAGRNITDLRPDELEMFEDGKRQTITNFSYIPIERTPLTTTPSTAKNVDRTAPPVPTVPLRPEQVHRTIALVVDDLGLSFESAAYCREALKKFIDQQIQPGDLVAIIRTGAGIGALQQFTSDKRQLYAAVDKVKWNPMGVGAVGSFTPFGRDMTLPRAAEMGAEKFVNPEEAINRLREDVFAAGTLGALSYVVRGLGNLPGRKSVVLFSDGFRIFRPNDVEINERILDSLRRLTDQANRASVVIYTLDPRGLQTLGLTAADDTSKLSADQVEQQLTNRRSDFFESQSGLQYLAQQTGGIAIRNTNDLTMGLKRIMDDQGGYYLIGYRPDESTFDQIKGRSKFHHIALKITRTGKYKVRMRNGFYGVTDDEKPSSQSAHSQIVEALTSPFGAAGIHLRLTSLFVNDAKTGSAMRSFMHVDARDLTFTLEPDKTHKAEFDVVAVAFGDNGQIIEQFSYTQTIRIKDEAFSRVLDGGFSYNIMVPIKKAGAYQLRTALRDRATEKIGSASQFIDLPDIKKNRLILSGILIRGVPLNTYLRSTGAATAVPAQDEIEPDFRPNASPAVRQLQNDMALAYGFTIFNAQLDKTGRPSLKIQVRVFKNGELMFNGKELPFDPGDQVDLKRLAAGGGLQLGQTMTPGEYVLQVIVIDGAKEKPRIATQWMDFEIVK